MYDFYIIKNEIPWHLIHSSTDHTVFKSKEWFSFIKKTQGIDPFIIGIKSNDELIGFFPAIQLRKLAVKIVASPMEGFTTSFQGLSLLKKEDNQTKLDIYYALIKFLFQEGHCSFFQSTDFYLQNGSCFNKFSVEKPSYVLDLRKSIDEIYKGFSSSSCKYSIKKSQKLGVVIVTPDNTEEFIANYYHQLIEVFSKQKLKPTYNIERVRSLIKELYPSGQLLLLEARNVEGKCIATGIFPGVNKLATFWGGASYREFQTLCPNEPLMYEAIKYWKSKGIEEFEFGGGRKYKEKYGPEVRNISKIIDTKYHFLINLKDVAKKVYSKSK